MRTEPRFRKRAMIYVAVLGTAAIVSLIGLSALTVVRVRYRSTQGSTDGIEAAFYAQSAIEYGVYLIQNDADWRSNRSNGYWKTNEKLGGGAFSLQGIDPSDGVLGNSNGDPLVLIGTGYKGSARHTLRIQLESAGQPLTCLETSLHAGTDLLLNSVTLNSDQIISANDTVTTSGLCAIYSNVEAVISISGSGYKAGILQGVDPRTMPDSATVFDEYVAAGATMDINLLPSSGGKPALMDTLISPMNNPYGATNADGIYVLDCKGGDVRIENCRIYGTLILLNLGTGSEIRYSVNWEPVLSNYPALMVNGSMQFNFTNTPLSESGVGTNFNPLGVPYLGDQDINLDDSYPSTIKGLIYISNDVSTTNSPSVDGVLVVGNTLTANGTLNLAYRQTFLNNPPPGFGSAGSMAVSPGTWRRVVN